MKVLLISANTVADPYPVYPVGLDYVAGAVGDRHVVDILDMNVVGGIDSLKREVRRIRPDVIGISIRNIDNTDATDARGYLESVRLLAGAVRSAANAPLVLGGSGFTLFPSEILRLLSADYGIVGEGERLRLLLSALEAGKNPEGLTGVLTPGAPAILPPPLKTAFFPAFDACRPHVQFYLKRGGMLNLQTRRGCPFKCIYCTYPYIEGNKLRLIKPIEVARLAKQLESAGARYLYLTDSAFNADQAHSLETAAAFRKLNLRIPWGAMISPTTLPKGYFQELAAAGMTHVEFGTESLSDSVLAAYRKPFVVEEVFRAHAAALDAGLNIAHFFLFGGPGETGETATETLSRIDKLRKSVYFFFVVCVYFRIRRCKQKRRRRG